MKPERSFNFKLWFKIYYLIMQYSPKKTARELSLKDFKFLIRLQFFFKLTPADNTRC